jgi:uncharacterized protein YodC (DUF2158 family)
VGEGGKSVTKLEDKQTRTTILVYPDGGSDLIVAMSVLKKGDRFRIETDMIGDHLYGHGKYVWAATSDAYQTGNLGVWGVDAVPAYEVGDVPIKPAPITPELLPEPDPEPKQNESDRPAEPEIGDVVRLRSGSPMMTVVESPAHVEGDEGQVICAWIRDNGRPTRAVFPAVCLKLDRKVATALESNALRTIVRLDGDSAETIVRMDKLVKGDRFRIETDDPEDHLFGKGDEVWVARGDAVASVRAELE